MVGKDPLSGKYVRKIDQLCFCGASLPFAALFSFCAADNVWM